MAGIMKTANTEQIVATLRHAAMCERNHRAITYDHGNTLVDLVAYHGDKLADAISPAWRPIETAPKDDTQPVLGFIPSYYQGRGGIAVVLWQGGKWWDNAAFETTPSHWMPLPNPPAIRNEE